MASLRRAPKASPPVLLAPPDGAPGCVISLPTLHEFLTLSSWEDGCRRVLGTVSLFWEDGRFKAWLNDKDGTRACCVSSETLSGLFLTMDERLLADDLEWRKARPDVARGRGK